MNYTVEDMLYLMSRLRDPLNGCPWDLEQTPRDIINYSIEEIYELADSVESEDHAAIKDELGDVLFQVVFLSRLAQEKKQFDFNEVVSNCVAKLVRRHPHVFADGTLYGSGKSAPVDMTITSSSDVKESWEKIKQQERADKEQLDLFDDVPKNLPALNRAAKLQKRAANIGLDWPDSTGPLIKMREEFGELEAAINDKLSVESEFQASKAVAIEEEVGDLLFAVVNFCRKEGISPEQALRQSNNKFISRVRVVKQQLDALDRNKESSEPDLELLDELWEKAKLLEN